uniref:NADH-ubiquinone oxidoreductase chain 6 n=1 Tax=Cheilomenes sexmaculata TaxID=158622 RepID=A0A8F5J5D6_9CUCU|nr:NADH dehydrogenase subunit 6 [Cheilomenes sexmaculata]QXM14778.1 NADH dehydrogenase subunit 6 [Cheilomenes sexmaculata]
MTFMLITTFMMLFLTHPLSMGLNLLIHTLIICMIMGLQNLNFWFSYILILIMIGGMLVLFMYMTSVASNEKFKFNKLLMIILMLMILIAIINLLMNNGYMINNKLSNEMINYNYFNFNLNKFITFPNSNIFIMIMFYLLITMIVIVKISKTNFGPLRQIK